jgi:hypothetical protein
MLKHLWICTAFVALGIGPAHAQKQEALLRHVEVTGADFNLVVAAPKPGGRVLQDLGNMPEALVVHLHGGALVAVFEDAGKMMKALDILQSPAIGFHAAASGSGSLQPVALYIVPKSRGLPPGGELMTLEEFESFRWKTVVVGRDDDADIPVGQVTMSAR